jgi:carbon-monoxide dehydrogenase catalytic subunit
MLHRTHMGVDNDYANTSLHGLRTSLSDGWGGSMIATELSDVMFGTPTPIKSRVNLGALRVECVNIALHGHNPLLSDVIVQAAQDPAMIALAKEKGAESINLVGLCCTGNELQMRQGLPMAGNHLMQELVLLTGALDAMVVDYQCIMPSVTDVAKCFHTEIISTADKARFAGATHVSFDPQRGLEIGKQIVELGIEAYVNRNPDRVRIPAGTMDMMAGFPSRRSSRRSAGRRSLSSRRSRPARSVVPWVLSAATTRRFPRTTATSRSPGGSSKTIFSYW